MKFLLLISIFRSSLDSLLSTRGTCVRLFLIVHLLPDPLHQ
uniref:Uncharacterized protein n=1 Tax=Arundo donax TaxID=35708 RepID=A0A0A9EZ63_ARUDO